MHDPATLYAALVGNPDMMRETRRMQYRCANRCLLLDAVGILDTVLLHQKRYKNSGAVNSRRSSVSGRARNTFDGENHWMPRTYFIDNSALAYPDDLPSPRLGLQCDHVGVLADGTDLTLGASDFRDDWGAGHAGITMRRDGTRFVVH